MLRLQPRLEGVSMVRRSVENEGEWEYMDRPTVLDWAEDHVALAVAGAALVWFGVVYVMTLVVDLFS
jgi:hypothetical protein